VAPDGTTGVTVLGAGGRMGRTLIRLLAGHERLQLVGAVTEPGDPAVGEDAGAHAGGRPTGVTVSGSLADGLAGADVVIDFTVPDAAERNVRGCLEAGVALVMGTTGLDETARAALRAASERIPVVYGRNMSVGINVLTELVRRAAATLGPDFDIEVLEAHHRRKLDAPSGTALQLGEAAAGPRGARLPDAAVFARHGQTGPRPDGAVGFAVLRGGGIAGDHSVLFAAEEEVLELRHRALDRAVFARGALRAAAWVAGRAPGYYTMRDVLGLDAGGR